MNGDKQSVLCKLINNTSVNNEIFRIDFEWPGAAPKAGQFFMVKPIRASVFLGRPISMAGALSGSLGFLIALRGKGTRELAAMRVGEEAELTGPLGNAWADFLPEAGGSGKPIALIGGGIGLAPFHSLPGEMPGYCFDLYAGFRSGFNTVNEKEALLGPALLAARKVIIATEDGTEGHKGRIPDVLEPALYSAVCACGPEPMLKAVAAKCSAAAVPCFVSLERRMACGVGACLGCTVQTIKGNRRCCADGPVFPAEELAYDA